MYQDDNQLDDLMDMVRHLARRLTKRHILDEEELFSAGLLGLGKALSAYNGSCAMSVYAYYRVKGEMVDAMRTWASRSKKKRQNCGPEPLEWQGRTDQRRWLEDWDYVKRKLTRFQQLLTKLIYVEGFTKEETSKVTGYSHSYVRSEHKKALAIIGKML
jgi:RNA polymerase sigma factor (sigma-70 family)